MAVQYGTTHRTNAAAQLNTDIGANAVIKIFSGSMPASAAIADTGTLLAQFAGNAGGFGTTNPTLSGVVITGTAGQFSCTAASITLAVGQEMIITGTLGGTGSITGYATGTHYWIVATNGSTTFTLSTTPGGSGVVTTAGTPTGLTYTMQGILLASAVANTTGAAAGTAGYFRVYPNAATTTNAVVQGTCGTSGTDMILTNTNIAVGQTCQFSSLTVTAFGV